MMKSKFLILLIAIPFLFSSCNNKTAGNDKEGDSLSFSYAKNITIVKHDGYYIAELTDPWHKGKALHKYLIAGKQTKIPADTQGATVVRVPLGKCVISTSVHCELARLLGKENSIAGVCDAAFLNAGWMKDRLKGKLTTDCGNSMSPDIEKIISISPDAIFLSPLQNTGGYGKVEKLGVPIIELADYMEPTALGRAEWVRFYALLLGAEDRGEKMFAETEHDYNALKETAHKARSCPTVVMDKPESGIWYLPGGQSTMAQLLKDANTRYIYANDKSAGSIQRAPESVLAECANADIWLLRYYKPGNAMTLGEFDSENKGFKLIKAFKEKKVYGCNTATNTFFEDVPFRPNLLLRDFIIVAHPEMKGLGGTKYFKLIEE